MAKEAGIDSGIEIEMGNVTGQVIEMRMQCDAVQQHVDIIEAVLDIVRQWTFRHHLILLPETKDIRSKQMSFLSDVQKRYTVISCWKLLKTYLIAVEANSKSVETITTSFERNVCVYNPCQK